MLYKRRGEWVMLELICMELGVEIGEVWLGDDGFYYCIGSDGCIEVLSKNKNFLSYGYVYWEDILTNKLRPVKH